VREIERGFKGQRKPLLWHDASMCP